jgi:uncharacterized protein involved in copper resistance
MIARTKIFLLWLLALAIPVQGFAAAAQLGCASPHPAQMTSNISHVSHLSMPAMSMPDRQHDAGMMQHSAHQQHQQLPADPAHAHHSASASCSSCSVCTIGAILPLALDKLMHLPLPADVHIAMTTHGYVGYTPENPERPPSLQS